MRKPETDMQNPHGICRGGAGLLLAAMSALAPAFAADTPEPQRSPRDGQHDFDFEIGVWNTRLKRLAKPLSRSTEWLDYEGTTTVRKVLDGRANLVELAVRGAAGSLEGLSLRLYNPASRQWSLNFANIRSGVLARPSVGGFTDGRGEFYGQEDFDGRAVLVRFVISGVTGDAAHFEQAFSDDGGKTWEVNWIADDTRAR
jgi:hypothetical protein